MAREPIPLIRPSGFTEAEKLYILSFEGTVTEKKYFEDLRHSEIFNDNGLIEIIPLKRPKDKGSDPFTVKKLLLSAKSEYKFKPSDEFWLIIDRDDWETIHKLSFEELVIECKKEQNFFLAMSNPCFELWLLLHLKDLKDCDNNELQLILENAKISNSKNYIGAMLGDLQGKPYTKRPNPEIYIPKTSIAIERARKLDLLAEDYPKGLGTHLYKLVSNLIKNKDIP